MDFNVLTICAIAIGGSALIFFSGCFLVWLALRRQHCTRSVSASDPLGGLSNPNETYASRVLRSPKRCSNFWRPRTIPNRDTAEQRVPGPKKRITVRSELLRPSPSPISISHPFHPHERSRWPRQAGRKHRMTPIAEQTTAENTPDLPGCSDGFMNPSESQAQQDTLCKMTFH